MAKKEPSRTSAEIARDYMENFGYRETHELAKLLHESTPWLARDLREALTALATAPKTAPSPGTANPSAH